MTQQHLVPCTPTDGRSSHLKAPAGALVLLALVVPALTPQRPSQRNPAEYKYRYKYRYSVGIRVRISIIKPRHHRGSSDVAKPPGTKRITNVLISRSESGLLREGHSQRIGSEALEI